MAKIVSAETDVIKNKPKVNTTLEKGQVITQ